jgi:hypothetical protein
VKDKIEKLDRVRGVKIIYPWVIFPLYGKFRFVWDVVITLVVLFTTLELPWELAFETDPSNLQSILILSFFGLDILISLRSSFFNSEFEEIVNWKMIAKYQFTTINFWLDLLSSLPFEYMSDNLKMSASTVKFFKFFKILRLLRLGKIVKRFKSEGFKFIS